MQDRYYENESVFCAKKYRFLRKRYVMSWHLLRERGFNLLPNGVGPVKELFDFDLREVHRLA
ncbi:hypothetical protein p1B71 (plasmid) [Aromatoleum aromaticum EbN1]|uniref:Uncharacterized protein n=1 Tax=Aromatoleum aromaticum (strain DSM 19018 / LMG 30748 / EbN1) TaxID=76114 RepID=Q5NXB7_AROAE|nr:hypothetical protein p1B71 [Aromatoleum aromaticum EbN1]